MARIAKGRRVLIALLMCVVAVFVWRWQRATDPVSVYPGALGAKADLSETVVAEPSVAIGPKIDKANDVGLDPPKLTSLLVALQRSPDDVEVLVEIVQLERQLGRIGSALEHARALEGLEPSSPSHAVLVGDLLSGLRAYPEARSAYKRALALSSDQLDIVTKQIETYQAEGDLLAAESLLQTLPPTRPQDQRLAQVRYRQLRYQQDFAKALTLIDTVFGKAAVEKSANSWVRLRFHLDIGDLRQRMGHSDTANLEFQLALHLHGELRAGGADPQALASVLGPIHAGLGNKELAIVSAQNYLSSISEDHQTEQTAELELAKIYAKFGDTQSAIEILNSSLATPYGITPAALRLDPVWTSLRGNSRFDALSAPHD